MMRMVRWVTGLTAVVLILGLGIVPAHAQFGRNKISYLQFDWHVYKIFPNGFTLWAEAMSAEINFRSVVES